MLLRILLLTVLLPASASADAVQEEPDCPLEPALSQAAAELLLEGRAPEASELTRALHAAGSDLVTARALFLSGEPDQTASPRANAAPSARMQAWLTAFRQAADAPLVCGYARGSDARLLLAAARAGSLSPLDPHSTHVRGKLAARWRGPELIVVDGQGELSQLPVDVRALRRGIPIADELVRPARIQLLARGPHGPRPIAERMLPGPGGEQAQSLPRAGGSSGEVREGQLDARSRLSRLRRARGLPLLRDNRLLSRVAAEHARQVCEQGRVVHELEPGADPEARLLRAGIRARRVGEALARASTAGAAFSALQRSPSHLLTLLQRGFTDVGLGEAADGAERACLVVLLAEWPHYIGTPPSQSAQLGARSQP